MADAGDVWAVPYMPRERWEQQDETTWGTVEKHLRLGWGGKIADAKRLAHEDAFTMPVATLADELGAPVGQMFTACSLMARAASTERGDG